jgi:hypothetical protein
VKSEKSVRKDFPKLKDNDDKSNVTEKIPSKDLKLSIIHKKHMEIPSIHFLTTPYNPKPKRPTTKPPSIIDKISQYKSRNQLQKDIASAEFWFSQNKLPPKPFMPKHHSPKFFYPKAKKNSVDAVHKTVEYMGLPKEVEK